RRKTWRRGPTVSERRLLGGRPYMLTFITRPEGECGRSGVGPFHIRLTLATPLARPRPRSLSSPRSLLSRRQLQHRAPCRRRWRRIASRQLAQRKYGSPMGRREPGQLFDLTARFVRLYFLARQHSRADKGIEAPLFPPPERS